MNIEILGYNRVQNGLRKTVVYLERELDGTVRDWAQNTRKTLKSKPYPEPREAQTYIRTGNLANRYGVVKQGNARYTIRNTAPYAEYVVGNHLGKGQAWMHLRRWWTARSVVQAEAPKLTKAIEKEIGKAYG